MLYDSIIANMPFSAGFDHFVENNPK